jgi:pimeloyl-ACP methyl ester carboxylesterase
MSKMYELEIEEHKLAAIKLNWADMRGTPTIFIHGIGSSMCFWGEDQLGPFLQRGPCYALTLPGHYPAAFPATFCKEELTADLIGRLLSGAIEELVGHRPVMLVGLSTGGFASLSIALHRPEQVERLVIVSGFCHGQWINLFGQYQRIVRFALGRWFFKKLYASGRMSTKFYYFLARIFSADVKALYAYPPLHKSVMQTYPDYLQLDLESLAIYFEMMPSIKLCDQLPSISAPALVMTGDRDPIVSPEQAKKMSQAIPDAELVVLQGAGHVLFAERPLQYRQSICEWLAKTDKILKEQ